MTKSQLFDRTFRLKHAPISMTQFVFTAGTIHLLAAANSKSVESDTALVKRCIAVLQSMGKTWKCASQSSDALQRLLKEWHLKLASSNENRATSAGSNALEKATKEPSSATTPQPIDMQTMLQQNPDVVQQLQQLGWAPPKLDPVSNPSSGFTQDLETLLAGPGYTVSTAYPYKCNVIKKYPFAELNLVSRMAKSPILRLLNSTLHKTQASTICHGTCSPLDIQILPTPQHCLLSKNNHYLIC